MGKYILVFPLLFGLNLMLIGCERDQRPTRRAPSPSTALNSSMSDPDLESRARTPRERSAAKRSQS